MNYQEKIDLKRLSLLKKKLVLKIVQLVKLEKKKNHFQKEKTALINLEI